MSGVSTGKRNIRTWPRSQLCERGIRSGEEWGQGAGRTGHSNGLATKVHDLSDLGRLGPVAVGVVAVQHGADDSTGGLGESRPKEWKSLLDGKAHDTEAHRGTDVRSCENIRRGLEVLKASKLTLVLNAEAPDQQSNLATLFSNQKRKGVSTYGLKDSPDPDALESGEV